MELSTDNALRFIQLYNRIDDCLSRFLNMDKSDTSFTQKLNMLNAKGHHIVSNYYTELLTYAKLRNVIVHESVSSTPIAQPSDQIISQMEIILKLMVAPPLALESIAQPVDSLLTVSPTIPLGVLLKKMHEAGAQQVPVIEQENICGVFSISALTAYIFNTKKPYLDLNASLYTLDPYFRINNAKRTESYYFMPENIHAYEVDDVFDKDFRQRRHVGAVLITTTGTAAGKLLGMVTAADIAGRDLLS